MKQTSIYYFNSYNETGADKVPLNSLIMVKNGDKYDLFNLIDDTGILPETELRYVIRDGKLEEKSGLPDGGHTGDVLVKSSELDGESHWEKQILVPEDGAANYILTKASEDSGDIIWKENISLPRGGLPGYVLTKRTSGNGDAIWVEPADSVGNFPFESASSTFTPDLERFNFFVYRLTGNAEVKKPLKAEIGQRGDMIIKQQASGKTITFADEYILPGGFSVSTEANTITYLQYRVLNPANILISKIAVYGATNEYVEESPYTLADGSNNMADGNTQLIDGGLTPLPEPTEFTDGDGQLYDGNTQIVDGGLT